MAQKFQSIVTLTGQARIAAAIQGSGKVDITTMVVGDGSGAPTTPAAAQTHLVNEVWRVKLNSLKVDAKNKNWLVAEAIAPASVGGFWMRELGLLASDGSLMAVCNMAETYKPTLEEGSGRTQTLRMVLSVTDTSAVTLLIDDSISLATEEYVNDRLADHELSRNHPDATLNERGFAILSSTISEDETHAATPKAVKAANDNADARVPSSRKVNGLSLTADITLEAANVGAYTKTETDTKVAVAKTAADNANANADGRVPSSRKVNGLPLTADINLGASNVGAYTQAETDTKVAVAKTAADNANTNANGRVPMTRKVNGRDLSSDINISAADVKALAVTTLRAQLTPRAGEVGDANYLPPNSVSFVYYNAPNGPGITGSLLDFSGADGEYNTQIAAAYNGSGDAIRFRTRNGDNKTWNPWFAIYHSGNKPTAADVGALPLAGGAMSGEITGAYNQSLAFADQYSTRAPFYDDFVSPAYSAYRPLIKQRVQTTNNAWAFSQGTLLDNGNLSWYLHMAGSSGIAVFHKWATDGNYYAPRQVVPGDYSNFDKRYFIRGGYADFDNRYFTKGETAAYFSPLVPGYAAVGSYIMAISYTGNIGPGGNVAGSSLRASTADGMAGGGELPGTWRCMGNMSTVNDAHRTSLWLRIS